MDSARDSFTIGNCFIAACVAGPMTPSALILAPAAINLFCNANTLGSPVGLTTGFVFCAAVFSAFSFQSAPNTFALCAPVAASAAMPVAKFRPACAPNFANPLAPFMAAPTAAPPGTGAAIIPANSPPLYRYGLRFSAAAVLAFSLANACA